MKLVRRNFIMLPLLVLSVSLHGAPFDLIAYERSRVLQHANEALAGGASTVTISTTAIIIGLLVLILLIVALN